MDSKFVFPRPHAPIPRPPALSSPQTPPNRGSNALRASVLDAALELGIGQNSTVTNWMFNNSLAEEEEEDQPSPSLTNGSATTSEESTSGRFPSTPPASQAPPQLQSNQLKSFPIVDGHIHFDPSIDDFPIRPSSNTVPFTDIIPIPPRPVTPVMPSRGKLRKKRGDGNESDGGYMSDAAKKKDRKKGRAKEEEERAREAKNRAKEEKLQEKREKEEERKRKKSMTKSKKASGVDRDGYATGYETDGASKAPKSSKKSKPKAFGDAGYETDSGYVSSTPGKPKAKSRFFGLGSKQSKPDLRQEVVPAMPTIPVVEKEPVSLPIASMFASTTLGSAGGFGSTTSLTNPMPQKADSYPPAPSVITSFPIPAAAPLNSPTSPTDTPHRHQDSYSSAESGTSFTASSAQSHSKRQGVQFLRQDIGHSNGGSPFNSTSPPQMPLPLSNVTAPVSPTPISPNVVVPLHRALSLAPSESRYPQLKPTPKQPTSPPVSAVTKVISPQGQVYPLSRAPSLSTKQPSPSPPPVSAAIKAMSPPGQVFVPPSRTPSLSTKQSLPSSPTSRPPSFTPQAFPTARNPTLPPTLAIPNGTQQQVPSPSPMVTSAPIRTRPRFPPTDGFGPRPATSPTHLAPSPSFSRSPSPNGNHRAVAPKRPTLTIASPNTITSSSAFIVPSPYGSPLPSPNVLAHYDIPPPSPPPAGPLPSVPPPGSFPRARTPERLRGGSVGSRTPPEQGLSSQPIPSIQRGREHPFPARPILPNAPAESIGPGLEARMKIPRYRELYGLPLPKAEETRRDLDRTRDWQRERLTEPSTESAESSDGGWEDLGFGDEDEDDMRDVLERFEEGYSELTIQEHELRLAEMSEKVLSRSRSFEAMRSRVFDVDENSDSEYDHKYEEELARKPPTEDVSADTSSRWSGDISIYSRVSVLDPEKSEQARRRFLKRVEDMYDEDEREMVPPVPKLPDSLVGAKTTPGRSWNRF